MYKSIIPLFTLFIVLSAGVLSGSSEKLVNNKEELNQAIKSAKAGDKIVLANGIWKDIQIRFYGIGTEDNPIILRAETPGKVSIEGQSSLKLGGKYLIVDGLYFKNGFTPDRAVIDFRINSDTIANHCKVINCVIEEFTQPNRFNPDHWVEFWGRHNTLDHCYIAGKFNQGPTIRVYLNGNEHIRNYHQITNNHFGPRPRKGGPRAETMQIGDSQTSMTPSYVKVANNYFEKCNGEVEIISSKSNFNEFRNNIFFECEGSLVMRHGNYCLIDGNIFIGNETSQFMGGIRIINTGHWVTNNYFYNLRADEFRAPLAIMNGIPKSPLNRYNQVTDAVIAFNSWINCESPWQISVGANHDKKDVLPASEIRSARPKRIVIANNLIYNQQADKMPVKAYDKVDGVLSKSNFIDNQDQAVKIEGIENRKLKMDKVSDWLFAPSQDQIDNLTDIYNGFGFENIRSDVFGNSRSQRNISGAIVERPDKSNGEIDKNDYGPEWYPINISAVENKIIQVTASDINLNEVLVGANPGDILELSSGEYKIDKSLKIDKKITIKAGSESENVNLVYSGEDNTPLFEMFPHGNLVLENVSLSGNKDVIAFTPLEDNMSYSYVLNVNNSQVKNFKNVLKAYRGSFADSILFANSTIENCISGIELAAEIDDKGDYNAEFVSITDCQFNNIEKDVINYYRGGYDESTIGGILIVQNSSFQNCGGKEDSEILIKTRGIINVDISNNTFQSNPVKLVALLWGEKNNKHADNEIVNSGKIRVDKYLKQKLMY